MGGIGFRGFPYTKQTGEGESKAVPDPPMVPKRRPSCKRIRRLSEGPPMGRVRSVNGDWAEENEDSSLEDPRAGKNGGLGWLSISSGHAVC